MPVSVDGVAAGSGRAASSTLNRIGGAQRRRPHRPGGEPLRRHEVARVLRDARAARCCWPRIASWKRSAWTATTLHYKQQLALEYAELVYYGLWFTPLREALDAFFDATQAHVTGAITLAPVQGQRRRRGPPARRTRCTARHRELHHGRRATTRRTRRVSSASWGCRSRSRALLREEVSAMKMWSGGSKTGRRTGLRALAAFVSFRPPAARRGDRGAQAFARALEGVGVLTASELGLLLGGLRRRFSRSGSPAVTRMPSRSRTCITSSSSSLVEAIGETGYKIHTGRSRNEQIATDLRLWLRGQTDQLSALLHELVTVLVDRAAALPGSRHAGVHAPAARRAGAGRALRCWRTSRCSMRDIGAPGRTAGGG